MIRRWSKTSRQVNRRTQKLLVTRFPIGWFPSTRDNNSLYAVFNASSSTSSGECLPPTHTAESASTAFLFWLPSSQTINGLVTGNRPGRWQGGLHEVSLITRFRLDIVSKLTIFSEITDSCLVLIDFRRLRYPISTTSTDNYVAVKKIKKNVIKLLILLHLRFVTTVFRNCCEVHITNLSQKTL